MKGVQENGNQNVSHTCSNTEGTVKVIDVFKYVFWDVSWYYFYLLYSSIRVIIKDKSLKRLTKSRQSTFCFLLFFFFFLSFSSQKIKLDVQVICLLGSRFT